MTDSKTSPSLPSASDSDTAFDAGPAGQAGEPVARRVVICNRRGLHARASAKFVKLAGTFDADVTVTRDDQSVAGTSIMGLLVLGAAPGCEIGIAAEGPEAHAAVAALCELVESRFGEE